MNRSLAPVRRPIFGLPVAEMPALMIGALTLSRIVKDPKLSADILQQARKHVAEF